MVRVAASLRWAGFSAPQPNPSETAATPCGHPSSVLGACSEPLLGPDDLRDRSVLAHLRWDPDGCRAVSGSERNDDPSFGPIGLLRQTSQRCRGQLGVLR